MGVFQQTVALQEAPDPPRDRGNDKAGVDDERRKDVVLLAEVLLRGGVAPAEDDNGENEEVLQQAGEQVVIMAAYGLCAAGQVAQDDDQRRQQGERAEDEADEAEGVGVEGGLGVGGVGRCVHGVSSFVFPLNMIVFYHYEALITVKNDDDFGFCVYFSLLCSMRRRAAAMAAFPANHCLAAAKPPRLMMCV